ncbi:hypothetical protein JOQ06_026252 [Pogonophryne albipinna]|uniref:C-type lectin domain-containing protein n=1 Tax=Pogonophryne albipinna TaxID=1090488 RepID=A0AAD6F2S4_9TELE|nr:hypothetical protein JOQ06_026252 [Pogonophryne albipinna]
MNRRTQQEMEEIEEEEDDYVNASRGAVDAKRTRPGLRFVLLIAVCWIILLAIMGLRIYLTSELSGNNAKLFSRIQELETRENNLKQQIQNMTTNRNELNITRAQWSIDSYCLGNTDKKCKPCQRGWLLTEPSCYQYIDAQPPNQKTWEEAQEDCSGKISDLAVAHNSEEKEAINTNSFGPHGFWIGLRVEDGEWKWVDGSDLTESSWIAAPVDGRCAVLYKNKKWSSVSCDRKHQWICQKKALSV